jgi:hypothetical protein
LQPEKRWSIQYKVDQSLDLSSINFIPLRDKYTHFLINFDAIKRLKASRINQIPDGLFPGAREFPLKTQGYVGTGTLYLLPRQNDSQRTLHPPGNQKA